MSDSEQTWFKPHQVEQVRDACYSGTFDGYAEDRNEAMIALLYDAGLRPSELVAVTTEMFDARDSALRLPSSIQKDYPNANSPPRATIGLSDDQFTSDTTRTLSKYTDSRWKDSMFLFPGKTGESMGTRSVRKMVKKAAVEAGVRPYMGATGRGDPEDVSPYTFRHSLAYRMLEARPSDRQATIYDVKKRLRHASVQTTEKHYSFFDRV